MTHVTAESLVENFRETILHLTGLQFDESKLGFLSEILHRRIAASGRVPLDYLNWIRSSTASPELAVLAQELTVCETYFFRHAQQMNAFSEVALPSRRAARGTAHGMRILSAGCATGEEPYSLAMLVRQAWGEGGAGVSLTGIDMNPAALVKAREGVYASWALRETQPHLKQRWFRMTKSGSVEKFHLDSSIRSMVRFEERNLNLDNLDLWTPNSYDVIFCRNVLMYFSPARAQVVMAKMAASLVEGGYLFLGHAETMRGLSTDFHLLHTHDTFYYQRKDALGQGAQISDAIVPEVILPDVQHSSSWVDVIREASERVQALTSPTVKIKAAKPTWELNSARELLRQERFAEALEMVRGFPSGSSSDPDVLLLLAVLLAQRGELAQAEETCRKLLEINDMTAGAHYVLALCREGMGDRAAAVSHSQVAGYLDPGFAMSRLHLGLLARRARDKDTARRELRQALTLLEREEASRLLLFGGGFSREALMAMCRSELRACGDGP